MRSLTPNDRASDDAGNAAARESGWRTIRKVSPYLWPTDAPWAKRRVVLALLALFLAKLITVGAPLLYSAAVDQLSGEGDPMMLGAVGLVLAYGAARLAMVGFQQLRSVIFARVAQHALRRIALETFAHIHRLSMRYHLSRKTGGLSRIIERGIKGVEFLLRFMLFSIGPLVLELVLIGGVITYLLDLWYLAVIVGVIATYILFTFRVTEWRVQIRRKMNQQDTDANQKAIDSLLNFETVKYFNAEEREARRYDQAMAGYQEAAIRTTNSLAFLNFGQSAIITGGLITVLVMAAQGVQSGALSLGEFVMVNAYMIQITMPLNFLGSVYRDIRQALIDMGDMFDLLEHPPEVSDMPKAAQLEVTRGAVRFEDVHFGYDQDRPILKGVSFDIAPGQTVAIVGSSGSGKSTLGRLLFRFYDVTQGAILIDGQDIRQVTQQSLHQAIGVVPQDTVLFNDTIRYNIAFGKENATEDEVIAAARAAQVHSFISSLPKGYDTQVGERGLKLSGGEKQRVGIARTLLKDPPILVLDEATSALDTDTEHEIQEELRTMSQGRTVMTIAHRLSTIAEADLIIVLENGTIIERGPHEELLRARGRYAQLWDRQQAEEGIG